MQQLVNFSNVEYEINQILSGDVQKLEKLFSAYSLDGMELTLYDDWDEKLYPPSWMKGVHLRFWPNWMDFWRDDYTALTLEFGGETAYQSVYGVTKEAWIYKWKQHIHQAVSTGAGYVVFHVSNARTSELYNREYRYTSEDVINATIELVNIITEELPEGTALLYENLWWPGLTFCRPDLAEKLIRETKHHNTGFMLDTGHLMNTNWELRNEQEAQEYIFQVVDNLGVLAEKIQGVHLHKSFSGDFVRQVQEKYKGKSTNPLKWEDTFAYIAKVDWHKPFETDVAKKLVDKIKPKYLVHEFIQDNWQDWCSKLKIQQKALGGGL